MAMLSIEAKPDYRRLGLSLAAVLLGLAALGLLNVHLHRTIYAFHYAAAHFVLIAVTVFIAAGGLRLFLDLYFRDVALQIDDAGIYVEGVTQHPIPWTKVISVRQRGRFVVVRTADDNGLIHFALFRPSFGRLGWACARDVIITTTLIDVPVTEIVGAITARIQGQAA
jgi:hypothetical protein